MRTISATIVAPQNAASACRRNRCDSNRCDSTSLQRRPGYQRAFICNVLSQRAPPQRRAHRCQRSPAASQESMPSTGVLPEVEPKASGDFSLGAVAKLLPGTTATILLASALMHWGSTLAPGPGARMLVCLAAGAALAARGLSRRSLDRSGAVAAAAVGALSLWAGPPYAIVLIAFFFTSSRLTAFGAARKASIEADYRAGGQRTAFQVAANAGVPTLLALLSLSAPSPAHAAGAAAAFLSYFACCCGDTWASELGVLSRSKPRLITNWTVALPGTNGAISTLGTVASGAGGLAMGLAFWAARWIAGEPAGPGLALLGLSAGLMGSFLDSLLGATVQFSGLDEASGKVVNKPGPGVRRLAGSEGLTNGAVNFISACALAAAGGAWGPGMVGAMSLWEVVGVIGQGFFVFGVIWFVFGPDENKIDQRSILG